MAGEGQERGWWQVGMMTGRSEVGLGVSFSLPPPFDSLRGDVEIVHMFSEWVEKKCAGCVSSCE